MGEGIAEVVQQRTVRGDWGRWESGDILKDNVGFRGWQCNWTGLGQLFAKSHDMAPQSSSAPTGLLPLETWCSTAINFL